MEGRRWIGYSRRRLHKNAVRGWYGDYGEGRLVKHCTVQVLGVSVVDILWLQVEKEEQILYLAVCYIPPESSSRTAGSEETMQALAEGVEKYDSMGPLVICGDFNMRCAWEC